MFSFKTGYFIGSSNIPFTAQETIPDLNAVRDYKGKISVIVGNNVEQAAQVGYF
jgi:hypothetical protein